jgi:hypothetical protein
MTCCIEIFVLPMQALKALRVIDYRDTNKIATILQYTLGRI